MRTKAYKNNSKKTARRSPTFSSYFQDYDKIFGTREFVNFSDAREEGVTNQENVGQATENKGKY